MCMRLYVCVNYIEFLWRVICRGECDVYGRGERLNGGYMRFSNVLLLYDARGGG